MEIIKCCGSGGRGRGALKPVEESGTKKHTIYCDLVLLLSLQSFRDGRCKVLISTDVAARGLDIPEIDLVIQCNPPKDVDSYIHRSGRTGRAGRSGTCICFYKPQEEYDLQLVERRAVSYLPLTITDIYFVYQIDNVYSVEHCCKLQHYNLINTVILIITSKN